jgi:prepilin-type N-terminal cleavage/methylation domain-containing protein
MNGTQLSRFSHARKGFTLVELAIVLVVIGLLIGGVLVAQSMIQSAKINQLVSALGQYETATRNFKTTYNQIPGDSSFFTPAGNNDGGITFWLSNACNGTYAR